jgi:hypothetical protein
LVERLDEAARQEERKFETILSIDTTLDVLCEFVHDLEGVAKVDGVNQPCVGLLNEKILKIGSIKRVQMNETLCSRSLAVMESRRRVFHSPNT